MALAEQLPPGNENLIEALGSLARTYGTRQNYKEAEKALQRQLTVAEKTFGAGSPRVTESLASLGGLAEWLNDYVSAENYFNRALAINEKNFGENSFRTSESLRVIQLFWRGASATAPVRYCLARRGWESASCAIMLDGFAQEVKAKFPSLRLQPSAV